MKKLLILLCLTVTGAVAMAQVQRAVKPKPAADSIHAGPKGPEEVQEDQKSRKEMIKALNLSREQKIKFKELQQANKAKKEAIENDDKLSETEKKEKLRELRKEQFLSTQGILNAEQKEKMKQLRKDKMKKGGAEMKEEL